MDNKKEEKGKKKLISKSKKVIKNIKRIKKVAHVGGKLVSIGALAYGTYAKATKGKKLVHKK